ncbi:hypothetical protein [Salinivibrio sp. VYel6]|uniref:hypothetical protein n=1 Tax=Salinivibrio sp. VYel6 TaxID=2490493 RepID=UPI001562AEEC|nr:hypothetical protein [Salinivibrio sp. VYel6]
MASNVTGARWKFAHTQHYAGACVTYANGATDVKVRVGRHKRQHDANHYHDVCRAPSDIGVKFGTDRD